ncbi:hypothetical protein [uncultured Shimia sp.]|uniref:hypothetical protein n=1 Tax=uncultured Shimia sp. TaxID=573152 RepID=UPI0025F94518|nr:hypothetical protein [uncultured Shimia sp.]
MRTQPDQIVGQLHSVLNSGQVPRRQRDLGAEILSHLSQAVRVVVLGRPGSGKTSLINMMLGQEVLHAHGAVDVVEVAHGAVAQVTALWPDGTSQTFAGHGLDGQDCGGAQRLTYEAPIDSLKTLSFCEVSQPSDRTRQQALLEIALQQGQVFVWCSEAFDQAEQAIWQSVPDAIKDHSFLALTKVDRQIMKGDLGAQMATLEDTASEEFLGLHPVATLHALKARAGGDAQEALWLASGGQELVAAVEAQVRKGRAADLDQARVLLAQLGEVVGASTPASEQTPTNQSSLSSTSTADTQAALLDQLQTHLQSAAQEMLSDLDDGKIPNSEGLLTRCASTVRQLTSLLTADDGQEPDAAGLLEDAQDGEETLMLLQVEQSPSAAEDAVILLLQLRKEIGARAQA